jgi:hypothetical protein
MKIAASRDLVNACAKCQAVLTYCDARLSLQSIKYMSSDYMLTDEALQIKLQDSLMSTS